MTLTPGPHDNQVLGSVLASLAPPGWTEITLEYQRVATTATYRIAAVLAAGSTVVVDAKIPRELRTLLIDLRDRMYRPGHGTWYTATVTVSAAGGLRADFDYDNEPAFDFGFSAWAADAEQFPREPDATPSWLAAKLTEPGWLGAHWQLDFTTDGSPLDPSSSLDATTSPTTRAWAVAIADALRAHGLAVMVRSDTGEDGLGQPVEYVELGIAVGHTIAFWRDVVHWSVNVQPDDVDETSFVRAARTVAATIKDTTGWRPVVGPLDAYERRLLGVD